MEVKHRMSTRPKGYLAASSEASIQARIGARFEPRHGSVEARGGDSKEVRFEESWNGNVEARCGSIEEASIGFLEGDEKGLCRNTRRPRWRSRGLDRWCRRGP